MERDYDDAANTGVYIAGAIADAKTIADLRTQLTVATARAEKAEAERDSYKKARVDAAAKAEDVAEALKRTDDYAMRVEQHDLVVHPQCRALLILAAEVRRLSDAITRAEKAEVEREKLLASMNRIAAMPVDGCTPSVIESMLRQAKTLACNAHDAARREAGL
jgi:hypothetical protein